MKIKTTKQLIETGFTKVCSTNGGCKWVHPDGRVATVCGHVVIKIK